MSKQVVVTLSQKQFEEADKLANEKGLSIAQYVKRYPITDDDFEERYQFLQSQAAKHPVGIPFTVMQLFNDWDTISKSVKLSLGRCFFHLVKGGKLKNVEPFGKNSSNVQQYIVKGVK